MRSTHIRPLASVLAALLLAACQGEPDIQISGNQMSVPVPTEIRQVAALRGSSLQLQISINGEPEPPIPVSWPINSLDDDANIGTTTVLVPGPESRAFNTIKIEWMMNVDNQRVLLASITPTVRSDQTSIEITAYNSDFDADEDGRTNLQEAIENRNPLSEFDAEVAFRTEFSSANLTVLDDGIDTDLSGDVVDPDPANTTFSLRHDGTHLIVYVCGQDNILVEDSREITEIGEIPDQYWHDDAIFIYLNGDKTTNTNNEVYDQIDDFQLAFVRESQELIVSQGRSNQFCPDGACITDYRFFNSTSSCQYEFNVRLPLADLNMEVGRAVGFDIEFTDDDNGGKRESSRGWIGFNDASNIDPRTFGTIILQGR